MDIRNFRLLFIFTLFCSIWFPCESKEILISDSTTDVLLEGDNILETFSPDFTKNKSQNWVWRKVMVRSSTEDQFLLEGLSPHVSEMQVWIESLEKLTRFEGSRKEPFSMRYLSHKNFTFPLPKIKDSYTIWIAMNNPEEGDIAFKIRSFRFFSEYAFHEYFLLGLYYGLLLIAGIYNLFLFLKSRIRLHLYYAIYMAGCILLSIREDGMGFQFLWPAFPFLNELIVFHLASPLFVLSFLVYSIAFLGLRRQKNILYPLYILAFAYLMLEILGFAGLKLQVGLDWLIAAISFFIYFSAIRHAKNDIYSRYFVLGFSVVILGLFCNLLRYFALIPSTILTVYSFNFGIFVEVIIFSLALAERVKGIQRERNEALSRLVEQLNENDSLQKDLITELEEKKLLQTKVNRELEQKVQERTSELQSANEKLKHYADKVNELNSALDLHNFSLKNEVKEATISKLNKELVDFVKFQEIYVNEAHCLRLIEKLKWPQGFVCGKCKNTLGSTAKLWYRTKCSRCGTIESVTAHTLFHNVRIPLQKAFYLTYLTFVKADLTVEQISEQMELRKATAWLFQKKVKERIEENKFRKVMNWQEIIVDRE